MFGFILGNPSDLERLAVIPNNDLNFMEIFLSLLKTIKDLKQFSLTPLIKSGFGKALCSLLLGVVFMTLTPT